MNQQLVKLAFAALTIISLTACQSTGAQQSTAAAAPEPTITAQFGAYVAKDQKQIDDAQVILIPQWHFSPNVNTRKDSVKQPQFENQFNIFKEAQDLQAKGVNTMIVEGCEGEIKKGFTPILNGWSLEDVKKTLKQDGNIDLVMTHVGLKAEAQYADKMAVVCGDNFDLIQKHLATLSDIRGLVGFKVRIEQYKDNPKTRASYLVSVKKLLKLKPETSDRDAELKLDEAIRTELRNYKRILIERNAYFVEAAKKSPARKTLVIGALHIPDLEKRFKAEKISYVVFKPKGLDKMGGDPIEAMNKMSGE